MECLAIGANGLAEGARAALRGVFGLRSEGREDSSLRVGEPRG